MSDEKKGNPKFDLNKHTFRLLQQEPFFAALSRRIHKYPTTIIPTAGVRVNPNSAQFEMVYNPEFFEKLPDNQKLGVLMHEFYHIIFEHLTTRLPLSSTIKSIGVRGRRIGSSKSTRACMISTYLSKRSSSLLLFSISWVAGHGRTPSINFSMSALSKLAIVYYS